jgi:hypothetical protein
MCYFLDLENTILQMQQQFVADCRSLLIFSKTIRITYLFVTHNENRVPKPVPMSTPMLHGIYLHCDFYTNI